MILHFITDNCTGGAQRMVANVINNSANHRVVFFRQHKNGIFFEETKVNSIAGLLSQNSLIKLLKIYRKITIVHVHLFPCLYLATILFPFKTKVFTEHSSKNRRSENKFWRYIDKIVYGTYDKVVAISHSVKSALVARGIKEENIEVIHNGVDTNSFVHNRKKKQSCNLNIGMAGRFVESKAHANLIAAMDLLPENFVLHLAGDGEMIDKCRDKVIDANLEGRVIFYGDVSKIQDFYCNLDIYIQASFWEGFGLTVVEANLSGLPVSYSCVDGLKEILGDSEVSFDPSCPQDMARSIQFINENRTSVFEAQCLKMEKYTLKSHLEKLDSFYKQFI